MRNNQRCQGFSIAMAMPRASPQKKDARGYMLFTCAAPHVFLLQKPEDRAALEQARVARPGDPRFAELDNKYLAGCKSPFVKSAIPKGAS